MAIPLVALEQLYDCASAGVILTTQSGVYSIGSVGIAGIYSYEEFIKDSFQPIFTYERWQQKIK